MQLPLPLGFPEQRSFVQYHDGANREAVAALRAFARGEGEAYLYLWGEAASGKTHLLQATCREAHEGGRRVAYLPLGQLRDRSPALLEGLERVDLVCLDDIDAIGGDPDWETALFHCFNRLHEQDRQLLVTAACPPARLPIRLPDLQTRLAWGLTLQLKPLSDADKLTALQLRARQLGLELTPQVGRFLLTRFPRDLPSLWRLLERLDHATLAAKRKLTIPFLKQFLEEQS
ncbi:DnaA-homolog protein [Methylomarinovum tepidoasis]|uniref:DnaA-homolog protein n=1 Tax=Methylomarinovum tepidoasis TaxID=2840183 RepID=A0AAU9C595_9GAMM|nr:DnaA regulatory inactivator Hda [Methylomarinovum sp. IN45]BCX88677.1 DnaA-homolog protein [Methylomarinovum sp. IN45]